MSALLETAPRGKFTNKKKKSLHPDPVLKLLIYIFMLLFG